MARPSTTTSTDRHRGAQTLNVTPFARRLAPSALIRSNEDPMASPFALVLHTHLPMVVNHGRWPHGSDWLCEAAFECYLPLLETGAPPGRRWDLAQMDDQPVAGTDRAACLA
jgi:hypothetical protein